MKIALLAPPYLSIPPKKYGGTERIVSLLAEGLVKKGHEVTLFASGDSQTSAKLESVFPEAIGNSGISKADPLMALLHYNHCFEKAQEYDIIHNHGQYLAMFMADLVNSKVVHTIHGSYYQEETPESKRIVLNKFRHHKFVSISNNQRQGMPELNYVGTVYNGLNLNDFTFNPEPKADYLFWTGRIVEKKGPLEAIKVAKKLEIPLKMAAAIDPVDEAYFEEVIKPEVDGKFINFVGEANKEELNILYGNALCTLFPITWHEPFGLVMIESMATGTPVVGYNIGAVAEIIKNGETGFVVNNLEEMITHLKEIDKIDRKKCRKHVEQNFTSEKMVDGYEAIYKQILEKDF